MFNHDSRQDQLAGEHLEGKTREAEEERRKNQNFGMFHEDANTSHTRLHEEHGRDRNK
jgi:hypothetical protein